MSLKRFSEDSGQNAASNVPNPQNSPSIMVSSAGIISVAAVGLTLVLASRASAKERERNEVLKKTGHTVRASLALQRPRSLTCVVVQMPHPPRSEQDDSNRHKNPRRSWAVDKRPPLWSIHGRIKKNESGGTNERV